MNSRSARVLLMLVIPGHLVFLYVILLLQGKEASISKVFIICYLFAALLQVWCFLLAISCMLFVFWVLIRFCIIHSENPLVWTLHLHIHNESLMALAILQVQLDFSWLACCYCFQQRWRPHALLKLCWLCFRWHPSFEVLKLVLFSRLCGTRLEHLL